MSMGYVEERVMIMLFSVDKVGLIVWTAVMRTRVGIVRMTGIRVDFVQLYGVGRYITCTSNFDADAMRIRDILRHWVNNPGLAPTAELK